MKENEVKSACTSSILPDQVCLLLLPLPVDIKLQLLQPFNIDISVFLWSSSMLLPPLSKTEIVSTSVLLGPSTIHGQSDVVLRMSFSGGVIALAIENIVGRPSAVIRAEITLSAERCVAKCHNSCQGGLDKINN